MKRWNVTFGLLAGLLALALTHGTPARAMEGTVTTTLGLTNTCNGENVDLNVTIHTVTTTSTDGMHTVFNTDIHGSGMGDKGNAYQLHQLASISSFNTNGNQLETTAVADFLLISVGPAPNLVGDSVTHLTFNADGTLTVQFLIGFEKCLG